MSDESDWVDVGEPQAEPPPKPKSEVGRPAAFLRGAAQGVTLGFGDELAAATQAALEKYPPRAFTTSGLLLRALGLDDEQLSDKPLGELYRNARGAYRAENKAAQEQHPGAYLAGNLSGGAVLAPVGVPGAGLGSAVATGTALGAAGGLGASEADLTKGDFKGATKDTLIGGGVGGTIGAIGHGVGQLAQIGRTGQARALADQVAKEAAAAEEASNSATGAYRSKVGESSWDLEVMAREAAQLPDGHPLKEVVAKYIGSQEPLAVREMALKSKMESTPERIAQVATLKQAADDAAAARAPAVVEAKAKDALANPIRTQVLPRLKTFASRAIPVSVGTAIGGPAGAAAGTMVANTMGRPGTAMANMMKSPAVRNMSYGALRRTMELLEGGAARRLPQAAALQTNAPRVLVQALADRQHETDDGDWVDL